MDQINKAEYDLFVRIIKSFSLFISGFTASNTFVTRIISRIRITTIYKIIYKVTQTINTGHLRISISKISSGIKLNTSLKNGYLYIINLSKILGKETIINDFKLRISFTSKTLEKCTTSLTGRFIKITASPILATFFTLLAYDPNALSSIDSDTLGDLDYVAT